MRPKEGFTRCPKCRGLFQTGRLDTHSLVHDQEDAEKLKEAKMNSYKPNAGLFESTARNLDATKNIGFVVRETGKYGTHPSHDGFDDESES